MKPKHNIRRAAFWIVCTPLALLLIYLLSFGPATRWVVGAVSGRDRSALDPSLYDWRLHNYGQFYDLLFNLRLKIGFTSGALAEFASRLFSDYDALFASPRRLADGREVATVTGSLLQGQTAKEYLQKIWGDYPDFAPKPGTEVFDLPLSHRVLVIYARDEDDLVRSSFDTSGCHITVAGYATLWLP